MLGCERFFLPILYECADFSGYPDAANTGNTSAPVELMTAGRCSELGDSLGEVVAGRTQLKSSKSPASHRGGNATNLR